MFIAHVSRCTIFAIACSTALAVTANSELRAQDASTQFKADFKVDRFCVEWTRTIGGDFNDKVTALANCQRKIASDFDAWRRTNTRPPQGTSSSNVCMMSDARRRLLDLRPSDERDDGAVFQRLSDAYDELRTTLGKSKQSDPKMLDLFGLPRNRDAQRRAVIQAQHFILDAQEDLRLNISNWAAAADPACFDCAVLDKWNVLFSASNLLHNSWIQARSHNRMQYAVGLDPDVAENKLALGWTESISETTERRILNEPNRVGSTSDLTVLYKDGTARKRIVLNALRDQWVNALDPAFIEGLQKQMCDYDYIGQPFAYDTPHMHFAHAKKMQDYINQNFLLGTFDAAEKDAGKEGRAMEPIRSSTPDSKCASEQNESYKFELKPWNVSLRLGETRTKLHWCTRWYKSKGAGR